MPIRIANKITTIICDDIRQEVGNKTSLMGIYDDEIIFDEIPIIMQRLSIAAFFGKTKRSIDKVEVILTLPESEPKNVPLKGLPETKAGENLKIHLTMGHFKIPAPGEGKVEIILNGDEKLKITHKFTIKKRDMPN